jgi:hypothetical protein
MEVLPFLDILVMEKGPKFATNVYWKPARTRRYLHFKANHPHHLKRGVVPILNSRAKVICQDRKDSNNDIKNMRQDLMFNEYPKEFVDSIMNPSRSNRPSSDKSSRTLSLTHILRISPKNSDALETVSISGPFSKLNIHSVGH